MRDPTPQPTNIDFRSKIDLWLMGAILVVPVFVLEFIAGDGGVNEYRVDLLTWLIVIIVVGGIGGLYATTRYTITPDMLLVRSGPFAWAIPLREITRIEPTRNPASSPAFSLDRLSIYYGLGNHLMVSPTDKESFLATLRKRMQAQNEAITR
ncbi:MAG: PH domain-containing protein [Candidatus Binatia bacterium]